MEKGIFNKSGMKQIINSNYKLFNKQTNCISYGNVIANTQYITNNNAGRDQGVL